MRLASIFALTLSLCSAPVFAKDSHHVSEIGEVRLLHGWAREPEHGSDFAQVFFEIEHKGSTPATLLSVTSDQAAFGTIMAASTKAGGSPIVLGSFPLTPGQDFDLGPESVFIQLYGVTGHMHAGDTFDMTVTVAPFGEVELHVEVMEHDAKNHAHAGHNH